MPINAHPGYLAAENEYLAAQTKEQKIRALKKMISLSPSHKGAENLRAQLKRRLAKLKYTKEKEVKKKKPGKEGIKKEEMQAVIIGETNTGKSSLLNLLTNSYSKTSSGEFMKFTTKKPIIGMMDYHGANIQIIENPAIESEYYDKGLANSADVIILLIDSIEQIEKIKTSLGSAKGKQIIAFNKSDLLNEKEKRKIEATLKSKRYKFIIISTQNQEGIGELKDKIFQDTGKIRIYTKEPGKEVNKDRPVILNPDSTVEDVAEKILKGFSKNIRETRIWGPSSKFAGQKVGLKHRLKDLDIVEFKTR